MVNDFFKFKQFTVFHDRCAFRVGTDGVLLGASADVTNARTILDIGTGSGLVALMLAQKGNSEIYAIEPHKDSFDQACENVASSIWKDRIKVENISLQEYDPGISFDYIISNPPFFSDSLHNPDPVRSNARHNDTLNNNDLLSGVRRLLSESGIFQVILPYTEGNILIAEAAGYGLYCNSLLKIKPLPSSEVRRMIITFSRRRDNIFEKFLTIEHGRRHEFTEEYMNLTRDFYLKF
jgi:tRNA1Val (adenine37-N6)-methyltransferase